MFNKIGDALMVLVVLFGAFLMGTFAVFGYQDAIDGSALNLIGAIPLTIGSFLMVAVAVLLVKE